MTGFAAASWQEVRRGTVVLLSPTNMLIRPISGTAARKSRTCKAAIAVSLTPLGIVAIFVLSVFVVGIIAGVKES